MTRLHATAAQSRQRAIECELALGFTLCAMAETEIRYGEFAQANKIVDKVRKAANSIRIHLDEPNYVPADSTAELLKQLAQLETRTHDIKITPR